MTSQRLSDTASKLDAASKLLRAKPEQSLIGDVGRAHGDARSAAASLAQQARALHLFDILDAPETQAVACIADLDRHAAVYATCAGLFLSLCGGVVHKLAASPCADVLRCAAQLLRKTAARQAQASDVGRLEAAVDAVGRLAWQPGSAAVLLIERQEGLMRDALQELLEALLESTLSTVHASRAAAVRSTADSGQSRLAEQLSAGAKAASQLVDSLVCALVHEDDADGVASYSTSLGKARRAAGEEGDEGAVLSATAQLANASLKST
ncbi:hypothetical protein EMIHUDRAFT_207449 [Emiliania huxleyi CCMP1516]|uniref:Mon2/Sec7/BIG1-like dimerisation and cyclophilin-binding domain-containing protein n=2 Tax=Emiliania huxleyi TaxID=2903 RepID=A0A0D3JFI0_EMIH1|nr:hypothetical protein EMIHUDRAFT_207449 [Emiliania huxleyi CCMP1516]EOD22265.1 hypothetical protein EMIHUDRAFT_207449 [Emiliania huxleyi CCMP1516]|eukprot:XP_005774694.1 hypothetical protein EMIHUDRAFT_207449 [Emiliania huxleyi CCMP1516]